MTPGDIYLATLVLVSNGNLKKAVKGWTTLAFETWDMVEIRYFRFRQKRAMLLQKAKRRKPEE